MFLGALGAVALLGFLSLAVILAQVVALVLLGFAPVALIIGIFPGAGHAFFRGWLTKLATAIFIKALYSLVIAIVVAVSAALTAVDRLARVPVRVRAADDLLLGDLPLPQADHRPARRRHHRRRATARRLPRDDRRADGRARRHHAVHRARRRQPPQRGTRQRSRRARSPAAPSTTDRGTARADEGSRDAAAARRVTGNGHAARDGAAERQRRIRVRATLDERRRPTPLPRRARDPLPATRRRHTGGDVPRARSRRPRAPLGGACRGGAPSADRSAGADAARVARGRHAPRPRAARTPARAAAHGEERRD